MTSFSIYGEGVFAGSENDPIGLIDEIPVEVNVNGYFKFETNVIITNTNIVYLNLEELFQNLGIAINLNDKDKVLSGFIENENKKYTVDYTNNQISVGSQVYKLSRSIIEEHGVIYVESNLVSTAFGLNIIFNYRALSLKLTPSFEIPKVKQVRLEKMRKNIVNLQTKQDVKVDTIIGRKYHLFKAGTLNWFANSFQTQNQKTVNSIGLGLGAELLYGEAMVSFFQNTQNTFDRRQLNYNWRWVDNDKSIIKQAQVGKISTSSIAFLNAPLVGMSFNNSSNTLRKATGTYTISEYTEPNWMVELYINDNLVDYKQADASGLFVFKVPIVYGYNTLKFKFYGLLGEERIEERTMNTPYTFMPVNKLEYSVSGGFLENEEGSKFAHAEANYGLSRFITIGGGVEYLSSLTDRNFLPFVKVSFQPFTKMVVNMTYVDKVSFRGLLNYYFGNSAFLEMEYSKYVEGQRVTLINANEERKIRLSFPYKWNKITGNTKLSFNQFVYNSFNYNQLNIMVSGQYQNYSANVSLASNWINNEDRFINSVLALSYKMSQGWSFTPILEYNFTNKNLVRYQADINKRIKKMSFSASYQRNTQYNVSNLLFNFKYDLSFARTTINSSINNDRYNFSETVQGGLAFGGDNGYVNASNNSTLGKGGILFYPFLDLNRNGKFDKEEKMVLVSKVRVSGGKAVVSEKDSIVRVSDLNSFINYNVEFTDSDLENISWRFKNRNYQVLVDPNQYKRVEVPIMVVGEVNGNVFLNNDKGINGQGRITVQIYDAKGQKVAETLSESDGYYSYLGLKPGDYTIRIDEMQLKKLGYFSSPKMHNAVVKVSLDGTILQDLNFELATTEKSSKELIVPESPQNKTIPTQVEAVKANVEEAIKSSKEDAVAAPQKAVESEQKTTTKSNNGSKENIGKISGLVQTKTANETKGIAGVLVQLYANNGKKINEFTSNDKGEYSFSGLKQGQYFVRLNKIQLEKIGYQSNIRNQKAAILDAEKAASSTNKDFELIALAKSEKLVVNKIKKPSKEATTSIEGVVQIKEQYAILGIEGVIVEIWNLEGTKIAEVISRENGKYRIEGVAIGQYIVRLNEQQLKETGHQSKPQFYNADVTTELKGKSIQGLDFEINKIN